MTAPKAWVAKGAPAKFSLFVMIHGWRGTAIDRSLDAYAREVSGLDPRTLELPMGSQVVAGGSAQIVKCAPGTTGPHGRRRVQVARPAKTVKGAIAVACKTADEHGGRGAGAHARAAAHDARLPVRERRAGRGRRARVRAPARAGKH